MSLTRPELTVELRPAHEAVFLELAGELEIATAAGLEHEQDRIAEATGDVILDLTKITFMDSTGLRAILAARLRVIARGGHFVLVLQPESQVAALLEFTDVAPQLTTVATREAALASCAP